MTEKVKTLLVIFSILFLIFLVISIKKLKMSTDIAVVWILLSLVIMFFALFPNVMINLANTIGMLSAAHAVFLIFILVLLLITFFLSVRLSIVEKRLKEHIQHTAIDEKDKK